MKIALINPTYDESLTVDEMVSRFFHARELARSLTSRMGNTTWLQGFKFEGEIEFKSNQLRLFKAKPFTSGIDEIMSQHVDSVSLGKALDFIKPDMVHITGILPLDIIKIADTCSVYTKKLSVSFHGGKPSADPDFFTLQKIAFEKISAILFNSPEQAAIWKNAELIETSTKIAICPETSSFFNYKDRVHVRRQLGITGDPVCVASARLHPIKDPMTLIKGFSEVLKIKGNAQLYWVYQTDELLSEIKAFIDRSPELKKSVHLMGSIDKYEEMEDFFNCADFFIQSSLQEYGGNSLVEAMSCGAIPVVTNIPSFRYLTGNNRFDTLFETGDPDGLARIITALPKEEYAELSLRVRKYFDEFLSFNTIAKTIQKVMS